MKSVVNFLFLEIFVIFSLNLIASQPSGNEPLEAASTNAANQLDRKSAPKIDLVACASGDWVRCGISLGQYVFSLLTWQDGAQIPILGFTCTISIRGRVSSWKWVWDGRLSCSFGQDGLSRGWKSRTSAAEEATKDFFRVNAAVIESIQCSQ